MSALPPGSVIGVLGGGQLGRMLAEAAGRLGFDGHVFSDRADSPAGRVAAKEFVAPYDDAAAARAFAAGCDVVTFEFENVPAATAAAAAERAPVRPGPRALDVAQDRVREKEFARACGAETATFAPVGSKADIADGLGRVGAPAILKSRREGYDGKGQAKVETGADVHAAWRAIGETPAILEAFAAFAFEVSLVAARGFDGSLAFYDLVENDHAGGVLRETRAPARDLDSLTPPARAVMTTALEKLDYVGVLAIEFFVMPDGRLLVNEFAPRVHNSGHWTQDATACGQFEQHIRAVAGWPLGDPARTADAVMTNLFGDDVLDAPRLAADPANRVHVYGKRPLREGRKTGHVTRVG